MPSFLESYREYSSGNEAHPTYHIFSGLIALSSIVGRRVWVDMGSFNYVPNLYVILVGPSGNRKTTAMTPAKNLIRALKLPYSAECVTKEKLVLDIFAQERVIADMPIEHADKKTFSPMTCVVTELSEFLGAGGLGMINFLTTIYDQDYYDIRTKNKGDTTINGPYLCLLACTTPDWITRHPALKGVTLPNTGHWDHAGMLVTKTLLMAGEGSGLYATPPGSGGPMFRAYDKRTGAIVGEVRLPANQSGMPLTYMAGGKQYVIVPVGAPNMPGEFVALTLP